jgi:hypothetical protein
MRHNLESSPSLRITGQAESSEKGTSGNQSLELPHDVSPSYVVVEKSKGELVWCGQWPAEPNLQFCV